MFSVAVAVAIAVAVVVHVVLPSQILSEVIKMKKWDKREFGHTFRMNYEYFGNFYVVFILSQFYVNVLRCYNSTMLSWLITAISTCIHSHVTFFLPTILYNSTQTTYVSMYVRTYIYSIPVTKIISTLKGTVVVFTPRLACLSNSRYLKLE